MATQNHSVISTVHTVVLRFYPKEKRFFQSASETFPPEKTTVKDNENLLKK